MLSIGLIGLGRMGAPIAGRLVAAGHRVTVHDVLAGRAAEAGARGAGWSGTAAGVAAGADLLLTVLPGAAEVEAAMSDAVLDALPEGAAWIDLSSNSPAAAAPIRRRAVARGIEVLEAPMGGGPADAEAGQLRLYVGGDADVLARYRPVLDVLAPPERIAHVGGEGAGYTVKLLVNALWFGQAVATAEALLLGQRAGVDPGLFREVLAAGPAAGEFIRRDLPALFAGDYLASFGLDRIHDQLATVVEMARAHGTPYETAEAVRRIHQQALERFGPADGELLAVALLEERAGTRLRPAAD
ncbi:NAD(P)-dependent oxidoreductase [Actinacidiphila acididurans]|uniref:NAD(P)-dependent oxidoreductase n=1 Tax=Actinacidiphila acididurans TaxID=2784346 RepID=A0ABS2U491_9ACTN|nr:NAD(P)-dependent oxidoreductase [Actinacidiphila acididurans]MBM9510414.1 NAD(P)-dependent oxidoreductase [Actinacidiphila acididurans]